MNPPTLTREQVRDVDRRAIQEYGMTGLVLMENAGRGCVDILETVGVSGPVAVCCGRGSNGGDGFVIARHLELRGHAVRVVLCCLPERLTGDAAANYRILEKSGTPVAIHGEEFHPAQLNRSLSGAAWIVDALLGTGAQGEPRSPYREIVPVLNAHAAQKLAVDLPSGLDCDTGQPASTTFRADHTCTFVAAKPGLLAPAAQPFVGQLHVLDIGAPRKLLDEVLRSAG